MKKVVGLYAPTTFILYNGQSRTPVPTYMKMSLIYVFIKILNK